MANLLKFPSSVFRRLREMSITSPVVVGLRNTLSSLRSGFYQAPVTPALRDTQISKDQARALYYSVGVRIDSGTFAARNIIDGTADYIGLPTITVGDENLDKEINDWIQDYWQSTIWQMYRNALRDSDCWIRLRLPLPSPMLGPGEDQIPLIEIYDSDRVTPYYNPVTQELERVEILTLVYMEDEPFDPREIYATGAGVHGRQHEIIEIVEKNQYTYWDATTQNILENFTTENRWGFVPLIQVFNDYDSALHGGSSDLEVPYRIFTILHDLIDQTLKSHGYHANPKVQVTVKDVMNFLRNNFPEAIVNGQFTGKVHWNDNQVFFMEAGDGGSPSEQISFVTANLNTGDSVDLIELMIDILCMAAGVTEGILFRAKAEGSTSSDEFERFKKKIDRKRDNFTPYLQRLIRMAMYVTKQNPSQPKFTWHPIDLQDLIDTSTAFNNTVTALEVLNRAKAISLKTYRSTIRPYVPAMKDDATEEQDVQVQVNQDNQQQLAFEKQMAAISPPKSSSTNGGGPNSASTRHTRVRNALPLEVTPSQPGE